MWRDLIPRKYKNIEYKNDPCNPEWKTLWERITRNNGQEFKSEGQELSSISINKATKKANTFKSCTYRGITTAKEQNCSLNGSGETTLGKHSSSPGHCTKGTAHHHNRNVDQGTAYRGKKWTFKNLALVWTQGDITGNAPGSCRLCSSHHLGQNTPTDWNSRCKLRTKINIRHFEYYRNRVGNDLVFLHWMFFYGQIVDEVIEPFSSCFHYSRLSHG